MSKEVLMFLALLGGTVFLLMIALTVPVYGTAANTAKATRARVRSIVASMSEETRSLLRERSRQDLSGWERAIEKIPQVEQIARLLEQVGSKMPAYQFVLLSVLLGFVVGMLIWALIGMLLVAAAIGVFAMMVPTLALTSKRDKRLAKFEEQLPDALSMIARALRAGLPFMDALKIASQECPDPMGEELRITFADMNYGMGLRDGFLNLMTRIPSVSLTTMVTAVLVQRDSGGNLADILDKVAMVIRSRFKLQRKILTATAEARMSAWVLALMPMALAAVLFISSPDYLPRLINDPEGPKLIGYAVIALFVGILWMRKIIRFRV